ncbi:MAG TPA: prenyltransferase [Flavobacteriales bacterium]|nr:prenyltransferase [Flavobacteriales bacterium]
MMDLLKLIRVQNLFIIGLTLYLIRYCVILPLAHLSGIDLQITDVEFCLMVFSLVLIGAGGYIINDYFDTQVDRRNKRYRNVVGKTIKRRVAMAMHIVVNAIGILIGVYLSYHFQSYYLGLINICYATLLWFYSTHFKHQPLIGNVLISLLTGLLPLIVAVYELPLILDAYIDGGALIKTHISYMFFFLLGFSVFGFLTNLIREIIKDMEDIRGDLYVGSKTLPITIGIRNTKTVLVILILVTLVLLAYVQSIFHFELISFFYFLLLVQLPLLFFTVRLLSGNSRKDYHLISQGLKLVMISGILFSLVLKYQLPFLI